MQIAKNRTMASLIALILVLTMAISLVASPTVNAAGTKKTYPVIGATPNPVGVGQETLVLLGITDALTSALYGWEGLTVTVGRPDGTTETLGPFRTDSTGMTGTIYVPTVAGNYTLQVHFPEQVTKTGVVTFFGTGIPANTTMLASDSEIVTLVVQQEAIKYFPAYPLPTEYWTRPIDDQLREWAPIAGNWLTTPRNYLAIGNDDAPESAHILWVKPLTSGGLVGGTLSGYQGTDEDIVNIGYETGDAYEGKWAGGAFGAGGGAIVMGGKLYYEKYAANDKYKETVCVDIHTGQQLWSRVILDNRTISRGQLMYWKTYDNQGVYDYLWVSVGGGFDFATFSFLPGNYVAFDPFTGDQVYTLVGMPSGTFDYGPNGELLYYNVDLVRGWMTMWNSTNIPALYAGTDYASMAWGQWQPMGKTVNATGPAGVTKEMAPYVAPTTPLGLNGYMWNKTIPKGLPGSVSAVFALDKVIGTLINTTDVIAWGISLKPGQEGTLLFNNDWKAPAEWLAGNQSISFGTISEMDGVFTVNAKESRYRYGFSTETGQYLWTISEPIAMLGHLSGGPSGESGTIAYGKLFCGTVSGVIQAYDVTNGKLVWKYNVADPYMQVLWSNNWPVGHLIVADGKLYIGQMEHSVNQPLPRGGPMVCLNATTGEVIWRANGLFRQTVWGGRAVIGDSIIATMDTYDQRVYGIGKGPSATTVTAAPEVSVYGNSVLVKGTVTDVSPGTADYARTARFPNGVPAVADEYMSDWMGYVYKQFTRPANATGVEVTLDTVDPNGNWVHIGTVTSDSSGLFKKMFTPEVPGEYTIIATFPGSKSYWASYAETAIGVQEAPPSPTPTPAAPMPPDTTLTIIGTGIAIIIVVAIIGILLYRKHP